jgi:2TM family of unknown function (DUF5676)
MGRISVKRFGLAVGTTGAILYLACVVSMAAIPDTQRLK